MQKSQDRFCHHHNTFSYILHIREIQLKITVTNQDEISKQIRM
jgi:hypothetical protein